MSNATSNQDAKFENIDYSEKELTKIEFIDCEFKNCNFTKSNLTNTDFIDCSFIACNFSMAVVNKLGIKTVKFKECKLMGIDFSKCNSFLFSASFNNCQLDYCSFFQMKMKKTLFVDCSLKEVDFVETDLTMVVFKNCDLLNSNFDRTNLEKADFRTAFNYSFDPEINKIKKAKFSKEGIIGLLYKYDIEIE